MNTIVVAAYGHFQTALDVIDRIVAAGTREEDVSLVMSDRAAARHFGQRNGRTDPALFVPLSDVLSRLTTALRPIAALGTPGAGVVATGVFASVLSGAGFGTRYGLDGALVALGASEEEAKEIMARLRRGAVLVALRGSEERPLNGAGDTLRSSSDACAEVHTERPITDSGFFVRMPESHLADSKPARAPRSARRA